MPVDLSPHAALRWLSSVAALTFLLLSPAAADAPGSACAAIGRDLAASAEAADLTTEPALLAGLLDPKQNQVLEPLLGFTAGEHSRSIDWLRAYLAPAHMSTATLSHLPQLIDRSFTFYDLRTPLDRLVVISPTGGRGDGCNRIATLHRDRATQEILPAQPELKCDLESAELVKLRDHGYFVALLDLEPTLRQDAKRTPERHYQLSLAGVGAATEATRCSFDVAFDGMTTTQPGETRTMQRAALAALWQVPPAPDQEAIRDWLDRHQATLVAGYLDRGHKATAEMNWPPDVAPDGLVPGPAARVVDPRSCGIGTPVPAEEAIRSILTGISDLTGPQCRHAPLRRLTHGRVRASGLDFLISVASHEETIVLSGFSWNPATQRAQLAALAWVRQTPTGRLLDISLVPAGQP